jgi:hypothetical protein
MPQFAVAELRRLKRDQAEELLRLGIRQTGDTLACARADGVPFMPMSLTHAFNKAIRRIEGVPHLASTIFATAMLHNYCEMACTPRLPKSVLAMRRFPQRWICTATFQKPCRPALLINWTRRLEPRSHAAETSFGSRLSSSGVGAAIQNKRSISLKL